MKIFEDKKFWLIYKKQELEIRKNELENWISGLKEIIPIQEHQSQDHPSKTIEIEFDCGKYSIILEITFEYYDQGFFNLEGKTIFLKEKESNKKNLLGWDIDRWHPHFLRMEEALLLCEYWKKYDSIWKDSDLPFLLLSNFTAIVEDSEGELLRKTEKKIFEAFGITYEGKLVSTLFEDGRTIEKVLREAKYYWVKDDELGWLFTNPLYSCQSYRNREHISEEGSFPFDLWNEMIENLSKELRERI